MYGLDMKLQRTAKVSTDSCRSRDIWVTDYALMPNINKIAVAYTSKEIGMHITPFDINSKLSVISVSSWKQTAWQNWLICLTLRYAWIIGKSENVISHLKFRHNPDDFNESILAWGDVGGFLNVLFWSQAAIALFERPSNMVNEKEGKTLLSYGYLIVMCILLSYPESSVPYSV